MKLGLGTVQFGCDYGISNSKGQVSEKEIAKILNYAESVGIDTLDTASLYGNSEEVLGRFNLENFKVVTKTIKVDKTLDKNENLARFRDTFHNSLKKLGSNKLYGLMFHEAADLLGDEGYALWDLVNGFKHNGDVDKIGVSVYYPEILAKIIDRYDIDIVQFPLNILDQRFIPLIKELKQKRIEIHTRSVFLQGLLLMKDNEINPYFDEIKHVLTSIPEPKLAYALQFVESFDAVDKIIVGTTCLNDLKEIVEALSEKILYFDYNKFKISDERFILPQNWRLV